MNILQILKNSISTIYVKYIGENELEEFPIYYIGGSQTLPPPLEIKEEEEILEKLSKGDESVRKILVERNLRLVVYIAKKFERCIENEILMYLRRSNKIKGEVSIDEPLNQDGDGNELLLSDILGTDPDVTSRRIEDEVDKKLLRTSMSKLNNRERNIMELRFGFISGNEKTQKEVADMLGISQSYISRLEKKIINKMKKEIISKTG